jgi:thiol-disulfide isomerase/thioredoxin
MKHTLIFVAFVSLLSACGPETSQEPASVTPAAAVTEADPAKGIDWFDGSVEEAFALARETGKPLFLYWGAEWCPPCHAIAATIFNKPEFINRSKLFVPVYLDGDQDNAQKYGEQFNVLGYPTMVVFSAAGEEITRIPGGIDVQAYANILDMTLTATSSARDLVQGLMNGSAALSAGDCSILAYHSWGQDPDISADLDMRLAFRRMYDACPSELTTERSILYFAWLDSLQRESDEAGESLELDGARKDEALHLLHSVLTDPARVRANIFAVVIDGARYTTMLTAPGSEQREKLTAAFHDAMNAVAADETIYKRERIYTLVGKMRFERIDDDEAKISDALQQEIRDMVTWADESTPSVYERQPVINALGNVLNEAGMDDIARSLLLAELEKSKQPYYFMVDLADIEQRAGNHDAAIEWLRKAYDSTNGPATRFQWGCYYVNGLLEMTPDDSQAIQESTVGLIAELLEKSSGFFQRPKGQLQRLESRLREWGTERGEALTRIRLAVQSLCGDLPTPDAACESFLEDA